ncbi:MAG TPA: N-acetylmuramoyl-L-alanine amidase [Candidatus Babeliales bacterium]|nr:N-acetylmuramoyl-L-alanine amidase [Candidatus Babeliales bacterium]
MQIKKLIFCLWIVGVTLPVSVYDKQQYVIVIDPAGDAKRTGRRIGDSFERGLTLQCAEKIKEIIANSAPHIKIVITRMPGDNVYDLQNASLANRLHADLFVSLNFYYTQETKPTIFLYQFSYGNEFASCQQGLALNSYEQAYKINKDTTDSMCQLFKKELLDHKYHSLCAVSGSYCLPIKSLIGIIAPSIALDVGLKSKELWCVYSELLANVLINVVGV